VLLENAAKTFWVISPEKAAATIYEVIRKKKQTVDIPGRWRLVGLIIQHIPSFLFRKMNF
jgi:short-subunit dehydrogenase